MVRRLNDSNLGMNELKPIATTLALSLKLREKVLDLGQDKNDKLAGTVAGIYQHARAMVMAEMRGQGLGRCLLPEDPLDDADD